MLLARRLPRARHTATIRAVSAKDASIAYQKEKAVGMMVAPSSTRAPSGPTDSEDHQIPLSHRGMEVIQDPLYNKGTAFEPAERTGLV